MFARLKEIAMDMSERNRKILAILIVAIAMLATYWAIFRWFLPEYSSLQIAKSTVEADIAQLQRTIGSVQGVEKKMIDRRNSIEESMKRFDWQVLKGDPLLMLSNQSRVTDPNFQIQSLSQGQVVARDSIWEVPFTVQAKGSAKSVQEYLGYIDDQDKAIQPTYLKIDYYDSFEPKRSNDVFLELGLHAYGSQQTQETKARLIEIEARGNIFSPTVSISLKPADGSPPANINGQNKPEELKPEQDSVGRLPRFNFPSRQEVNR